MVASLAPRHNYTGIHVSQWLVLLKWALVGGAHFLDLKLPFVLSLLCTDSAGFEIYYVLIIFLFVMFCRTCFNMVVRSMHRRCMEHPVLLVLDQAPFILMDHSRLNHYKEPLFILDHSTLHFRRHICMVPLVPI